MMNLPAPTHNNPFVPQVAMVFYERRLDEEQKEYYAEQIMLHPDQNGGYTAGSASPMAQDVFDKLLSEFGQRSRGRLVNGPQILPREILYLDSRADNFRLVWHVEASVRTLFFRKDTGPKTGKYPLPDLLFSASSNTMAVAAIPPGTPTEETELYYAPFWNVNSLCNVCLGTTIFPDWHGQTYQEITRAYTDAFFESEFNALQHDAVNGDGMKKLFKQGLEDKTVFPFERLKPTGMKLKKWLLILSSSSRA